MNNSYGEIEFSCFLHNSGIDQLSLCYHRAQKENNYYFGIQTPCWYGLSYLTGCDGSEDSIML